MSEAIFNGRTALEHADDAYEAVRAINHLTMRTIPAPAAYGLLGNLKGVGYLLPQALEQIGQGLSASLTEYDVYEDDGADPAVNVEAARRYLREAADYAKEIGRLLDRAQSAIAQQGHR